MIHEEGGRPSAAGICKFLWRYEWFSTIARKPGSGRPTKVMPEVTAIVDQQMVADDKTTAVQLQRILEDKGHLISLVTILCSMLKLGWTFRSSVYCQLIKDTNKEKRLAWAREHVAAATSDDCGFKDVWMDESSVQLETHRWHSCRRRGQLTRPKPRYVTIYLLCIHALSPPFYKCRAKHPVKVHVWAGISWKGPTPIVIFEGTMDAIGFIYPGGWTPSCPFFAPHTHHLTG